MLVLGTKQVTKGMTMNTKSNGFSLIELLIVVAIILIIAAIAIPNFLRSRVAANQASAVESLRALSTAEFTYSSTYNVGYTATLGYLGPPPFGSADDISHADIVERLSIHLLARRIHHRAGSLIHHPRRPRQPGNDRPEFLLCRPDRSRATEWQYAGQRSRLTPGRISCRQPDRLKTSFPECAQDLRGEG